MGRHAHWFPTFGWLLWDVAFFVRACAMGKLEWLVSLIPITIFQMCIVHGWVQGPAKDENV